MQIVVALCSFNNKIFIHWRKRHKSIAINNIFLMKFFLFYSLNSVKYLFTVKECLVCLVMI